MLISGKIELDFCLFARGNAPARIKFAEIIEGLQATYHKYLIQAGEVRQQLLPVSNDQVEEFKSLGRTVIEDEGQFLVSIKSMTITVGIPDEDVSEEKCYVRLSQLLEDIQGRYIGLIITARLIVTKFISDRVAI